MIKQDPWAGLTPGTMKRVRAAGKYDLFWAVVEKGAPAFVAYLKEAKITATGLPKLKNIELKINVLPEPCLVMSLLDGGQREIFETLCRDIIESAEQASTHEIAIERALRRMRRWHLLLKGGSVSGLTLEEQRGLVGELAFLRYLVGALGAQAAIESWKGPEGSSKDFEFPMACIEIKAKRGAAKPYVRISSEDQLSDVGVARLFLRVYEVDSVILPGGYGLSEHVELTRELFVEDLIALNTLDSLLERVGFDSDNDYEARRWIVGKDRTFEVTEGFPRIVSPLIEGVGDVTYSISLDSCASFETIVKIAELVKGE